jgi:hypothetical protein
VIVNEQDLAYEEALAEARRREAEKEEARRAVERAEAERKAKIAGAVKRFNSLPADIAKANPSEVVSARFTMSRGQVKLRDFLRSDTVADLFAFVDIDYAPKEPILRYGFPPKVLRRSEGMVKLGELGVSRKETFQVLSSDDEDE